MCFEVMASLWCGVLLLDPEFTTRLYCGLYQSVSSLASATPGQRTQ